MGIIVSSFVTKGLLGKSPIDGKPQAYKGLLQPVVLDRAKQQRIIQGEGGGGGAKLTWWHGSPSGELKGGPAGLHAGTRKAAQEALEARIGIPAKGGWDGTREYGKTLLAGQKTLKKIDPKGYRATGYNARGVPLEDYYPMRAPKYGSGEPVPMTAKPVIREYSLVGPMSNTPRSPHPDFKAGGYMRGAIKRGNAKRGYYYTNQGEDAGSISVVVPSAAHLVLKK